MKRKNIFKVLAGIAIAFTLAGCTNNGTAKNNGKASTLIVNKKSGKVQTDATKANNAPLCWVSNKADRFTTMEKISSNFLLSFRIKRIEIKTAMAESTPVSILPNNVISRP